jgi:prepilin-type N-terminal cleavage/methylation domain-containing protein
MIWKFLMRCIRSLPSGSKRPAHADTRAEVKGAGSTRLEVRAKNAAVQSGTTRITGFTLIELLVVIAVIALLMSFFMPALERSKRQAKCVICQSNLHQWAQVFSMYTSEFNGLFPKDCHAPDDYSTLAKPYLKDERLRLCPTATRTVDKGGRQPFAAWQIDDIIASYGLNDWILSGWPGISDEQDRWLSKTPNARGINNVPLLMDCSIFTYVNPRHYHEPPAYEQDVIYQLGKAEGEIKRFCVNRHDEMTNGLFLDFSVRRVGLKEIWELRWHRNWPIDAPPPVWPAWMKYMKDYYY